MHFSLRVIVFLCGQNKRGNRKLLTLHSLDDKKLVSAIQSLQWKDVKKSLDLAIFKKPSIFITAQIL